jgi:hypothetical protein
VRYGAYLSSLLDGQHTLYRQMGDSGLDFDIFD